MRTFCGKKCMCYLLLFLLHPSSSSFIRSIWTIPSIQYPFLSVLVVTFLFLTLPRKPKFCRRTEWKAVSEAGNYVVFTLTQIFAHSSSYRFECLHASLTTWYGHSEHPVKTVSAQGVPPDQLIIIELSVNSAFSFWKQLSKLIFASNKTEPNASHRNVDPS